ncbi:MAG TPA: hypothetical protein VM869_31455 [Enhygromyxa sp.]|nr:hypothetical protein [Enhygromyxa sp.]
MWVDEILILLVIAGMLLLFGRGLSRTGWFGGSRSVSSGAASFLGELDHMLNPQRPTIEDIRHAKEDDDEQDEQGDPPDDPADAPAESPSDLASR